MVMPFYHIWIGFKESHQQIIRSFWSQGKWMKWKWFSLMPPNKDHVCDFCRDWKKYINYTVRKQAQYTVCNLIYVILMNWCCCYTRPTLKIHMCNNKLFKLSHYSVCAPPQPLSKSKKIILPCFKIYMLQNQTARYTNLVTCFYSHTSFILFLLLCDCLSFSYVVGTTRNPPWATWFMLRSGVMVIFPAKKKYQCVFQEPVVRSRSFRAYTALYNLHREERVNK